MAEIKAIETIYNGYRFRSRLEARWAVLFDDLGFEYDYEKEGYDLGELGWYLPDFYLPESKVYVEVKGNKYDIEGIKKAKYFDNHLPDGDYACIVVTRPELAEFDMTENGPEFNDAFLTYQIITQFPCEISIEKYNRAVLKARQARFEHGEKG